MAVNREAVDDGAGAEAEPQSQASTGGSGGHYLRDRWRADQPVQAAEYFHHRRPARAAPRDRFAEGVPAFPVGRWPRSQTVYDRVAIFDGDRSKIHGSGAKLGLDAKQSNLSEGRNARIESGC